MRLFKNFIKLIESLSIQVIHNSNDDVMIDVNSLQLIVIIMKGELKFV